MQSRLPPLLAAAIIGVCGVRAQEAAAPEGASTPPAAAQQSAPVPAATLRTAPAPSQVIYALRLPTAAELTSVAAAQGLTVEQISQTGSQVTAIYRNASGQTNTVAYQLLPASRTPATPTTVIVPSPAPTIVYEEAPRVICYDAYDPFWPRYYPPPISLHFSFGYTHWSGNHGWGGSHRGGWHRR